MKKLPKVYRLTLVDGKLACESPSKKTPTSVCKGCQKNFDYPHFKKAGRPQLFCTIGCQINFHSTRQNTIRKEKRHSTHEKKNLPCKNCREEFEYIRKGPGGTPKFCGTACRKMFFNRAYYVKRHSNKGENLSCKQCKKEFFWKREGRSAKKKYCSAKCRETYFNEKYKHDRKERLAKAAVHCHSNPDKKGLIKPVEKLHGVHQPTTGAFVAKVKEALATLPPEETLPPPMPVDKSASSLLSAGRTLTEIGLAEAVKDVYNIEIKDQPLRARSFWFSILLAKHSKDLKDWRTKLEKHGLKSKPSVEKWLLFRGASATTASASGLKSRLDI